MQKENLTLPAKYYIDPEYFKRELEAVFAKKWMCVGRADQLPKPGSYFLAEIAGESLIMTRGEDGKIRSLYNVCRHRGTRLCDEHQGSFSGRIQCPYHAWTYGLDGRLVAAPHMNDLAGFSLEKYPLQQALCDTWDGHIFVNLSGDAAPLRDQLGPMQEKFRAWKAEDLRLGKRILYSIKANWKLIIQNYSECLHCPVIHPTLKKLSHYMSGDNEPASPFYLGGSMDLNADVKTMTVSGQSQRAILPDLDETERRKVYYYFVFPNLLLSFHPDYLMTHTLWPRSEGHTDVICEFHFHKDEISKSGFTAEDAAEFWDGVNREDWRVSELSQLGLKSRAYRPGPYSNRETLLHGLDVILTDICHEPPVY